MTKKNSISSLVRDDMTYWLVLNICVHVAGFMNLKFSPFYIIEIGPNYGLNRENRKS